MQTELEKFESRLEMRERLEHQNALLSAAAFLATKEGKDFFKYLFKCFEVATLPEMNLEGIQLHEKLGFLRAGNSIYQLACQAAGETTAGLLSQIEREKYENILERYRIEHGLSTSGDADSDSTDN